jgi:hypothetical protein
LDAAEPELMDIEFKQEEIEVKDQLELEVDFIIKEPLEKPNVIIIQEVDYQQAGPSGISKTLLKDVVAVK